MAACSISPVRATTNSVELNRGKWMSNLSDVPVGRNARNNWQCSSDRWTSLLKVEMSLSTVFRWILRLASSSVVWPLNDMAITLIWPIPMVSEWNGTKPQSSISPLISVSKDAWPDCVATTMLIRQVRSNLKLLRLLIFVVLDDLNLLDGTASPSASVFANQWRLDRSVSEKEREARTSFDRFLSVPWSSIPRRGLHLRRYATTSHCCLSNPSRSFRRLRIVFTSGKHISSLSSHPTVFVKVNGEQYYNACLIDYCMTATYHPKQLQEAMCNSYTALARDCTDNFLEVNWRTASRCRT